MDYPTIVSSAAAKQRRMGIQEKPPNDSIHQNGEIRPGMSRPKRNALDTLPMELAKAFDHA
jgi:hypothetical protein